MNQDTTLPEPQQVDPQRLLSLLQGIGWHQAGGREGSYSRLAPPASSEIAETTLIVPLDDSAPDYPMLMEAAIRSLAMLPDTTLRSGLLQRLAAVPTDEFRFSKETAAPPGWIAWSEGEELFASARAVLAAGAKRWREPSRHYSNRHGRFATRYIESALMGQTSQGSFIIHAYVPTEAQIPVRANVTDEDVLPGLDSGVTAREISRQVVQTVQATREALDHYATSGTFDAFDDPKMPVSYEAANAIQTLASGAQAASVEVAWDPGETAEPPSIARVEFEAADAPILEQAATRLATPESKPGTRVVGMVHLLTRAEVEGPGVVGVTTIDARPARKIRVRLNAEDYQRAIRTHAEGAGIEVEGTLEREGNLFWLYNAQVVRQVTPNEVLARLMREPDALTGQVTIEDLNGRGESDT